MRRLAYATLAAFALAAAVSRCTSCDERSTRWRIATFNIENFPKHARQIDGAFREIARLDAGIVAVQEITDPVVFATAARERLGADWSFVHIDTEPRANYVPHHLGVLFDRRRFHFQHLRIHEGTRLDGNHKPTLDVELRSVATGKLVRVLVVHLKAGGENQPIRHRQHVALAKIVAEVKRSRADVVVLGDFNATSDADRKALAKLAEQARMTWATERLPCSSFWNREDGCPRSTLDHAVSSRRPVDVRAAGGCETEGCDRQDRCPLYFYDVSDHCPVVMMFE